jgi:hypothetical protein
MMRMAKMAEDEGGGDELGAAGSLSAEAGCGTEAGRPAGGHESGRGGAATGRGGLTTDFSALSELLGRGASSGKAGAEGERPSAGSDGERDVLGALVSSASASCGFERRRGMGGGELSGATPGTGVSIGTASALAGLTLSALTSFLGLVSLAA